MENNLNKITCDTYPDWYTEEIKEEYQECINLGRLSLGKNYSKCDEYLIDLASKMTINAKYKKGINLTQEQLDKIKQIHQETFKMREFKTPEEGWYTTEKNPLNCPYVPEILPHNATEFEETNEIIVNKDIA